MVFKSYLERVVGWQWHVETLFEKSGERIVLVLQEQLVVAERTNGETDLLQVIQVLQHRRLGQIDAVIDVLGDQETWGQMINVAWLAAVWSEIERFHATKSSELVQRGDVCPKIVIVVRVGRIFFRVPLRRIDFGRTSKKED